MVESGGNHSTFRELPIIGKSIQDFDKLVGVKGLQASITNLIDRTNGRLHVTGREGYTEKVLSHEPVLVIGNHPYDAEFIPLLAALPPREDIFIIAGSDLLGIGPNLNRNIIPVYVGTHKEAEHQKLSVRIGKRFQIGPSLTRKEERERNNQAIKKASQRIAEGGLVILFPEGIRGKRGKWFSGIGRILHELGCKTDSYLVKALIEGTSNFDPFRLVPGIRRLLPHLKVTFSKPQKASSILADETSPRNLASKLQGEYQCWSEKIKSSK